MLARMIHDRDGGWSFASAREPARFAAGVRDGVPGVEHAMAGGGTLCGVPGDQVTRYRHLFAPRDTRGSRACPECREQAAATPAQPSVQERLHDTVQAAAPGPARDDLLAALRRGAPVGMWIHGPAGQLARDCTGLGALTEGAGPVAEAFGVATTIGLARVEDGAWCFVVVLPDGGRPLVARAPRDPG